ncbi:MAG: AAA family ATPase [Gaiellales bacterium]
MAPAAASTLRCGACGFENEIGRKFCGECGAGLSIACPTCGTPNAPSMKFCGECGARLAESATVDPPVPVPVAERRLVTVLFGDLAGYTSLVEGRDFEDVRDLQTSYFETARTVIERYGGVVEKYIGDAVMAVWGAPVAREDDAERAVRAALDLVDAVGELGVGAGAPELRLRVGVLTGEAAVTLGATGQGMVTGDLVNTASRIQGVTSPGSVLVGEATRRASEAAIVYADEGAHALKGKAEPVTLWRAVRVIAALRGEGRSVGLEAPFVGRERELRLVKDLFHATADERKAHLLSVVGVAGIGKSRLAWEFEKYLDGLAGDAWWHRGRCLAYGEGVAYWALAEMVRMRARISEDESSVNALAKLAEVVAELVPDPVERALVEPRLQHLLGLTERVAPDREDLFSAWRLFVERLADVYPVVMVFDDLHWADAGLLDFIEYLLDRSRSYPIFVVTLARPELSERHGWGAHLRGFTSLALDPLPDAAVDALLRGLVPGLPDAALARIRERAEGIPLYAVETVRMLLDRGLLRTGEEGYETAGDLEALDVPETLHALIAARLDGLRPGERRVLQDGAVLGKTFSVRGLAALSGAGEGELSAILDGLVRKELLYLESDPRAPERGQYGFLQALVQRVAYETLSRRDRKARHLGAAGYLTEEAGTDPDEIAEVVAAHYLDAIGADEGADDVAELRTLARAWLERAGERAESLAAADDARRAFEAAAGLTADPAIQAGLLERAGAMARMGGAMVESEQLLARAADLYRAAGDSHAVARATARLARVTWGLGRNAEAIALAEDAFAVLASDEPDADLAELIAELARLHFFTGEAGTALSRIEAALDMAESLGLPAVLSSALNTKAMLSRHPHEQHALLQEALSVALEHDLVFEALRAYNNLAVSMSALDRVEQVATITDEAYELARRRGDRDWEEIFASTRVSFQLNTGRWDDGAALAHDLALGRLDTAEAWICAAMAEICWQRGDDEAARGWLERAPATDDRENFQWRSALNALRWTAAVIDGRHDVAVRVASAEIVASLGDPESPAELADPLSIVAWVLPDAVDAGDAESAVAAVRSAVDPSRWRRVTATLARVEGLLAARRGDHDAAADRFGIALAAARSLDHRPWVAGTLTDYAGSLVAEGRPAEARPLLTEARQIAEELRAVRMLSRIERLAGSAPEPASVG